MYGAIRRILGRHRRHVQSVGHRAGQQEVPHLRGELLRDVFCAPS